ncbi:MAG: hypothetical protein ABI185_07895 [Ginsengibacter sp.]
MTIREFTKQFANDWINAWNEHDVEKFLSPCIITSQLKRHKHCK